MTGTLRIIKGKPYYYVSLSYKDPITKIWKNKTISTGLSVKNNKRKAEALIPSLIKEYAYLEKIPEEYCLTVNPDITVCEYLDSWLEGKRFDLKKATYEGYEYRAKRIKDYFQIQNPKMRELTPKMVDTFLKYSQKYGKINQKTQKKEQLSVRSVRSYKSILCAACSQAVIDGLIPYNPTNDVKVHGKRNKDYADEMMFLTEEEIAEFLFFLSIHHPNLIGIAFFASYYGLRRSEILGLKWSAIDFQKKIVHIRHTVVRVKTTQAENTTKTTAGRRDLNLFPTAQNCLLKIRKEQEENKAFFKRDYKNKEGYIFTWEDGSPFDPDYITKQFKKSLKEFGRPELSLHKLRHSCASMLINRGWDVKKLQYWLGHSDTQTTLNIYAHFNKMRLNTCENDLTQISSASERLFVDLVK